MLKKELLIFMMVGLLSVSVFAAGTQEEAKTEEFPAEPIKLIVPYGAGGGTDSHARLLQKKMEELLPVPLVVVNMGGGAGSVGGSEVLNADPDGYTLLIQLVNVWTSQLLGNTDFGPFDYEPVAEAGKYYLVQATQPDAPWSDLSEYLEAAKQKPGEIKEATNIGAITHFNSLGLQEVTGAEFHFVHIGDGAERISNTLGGHVDSTQLATHAARKYLDSGEMKILGLMGDEEVPGYEEVPTTDELGIDWSQPCPFWFFYPKGTSKERIDYMADIIEQVMTDPEVVELLKKKSVVPSFARGEELEDSIRKQGKQLKAIAEKYDLSEK